MEKINNRLIERMLEIPRFREAYLDHLEQYLGTVFAEEKVHRQVTEAADFLRPLINANGSSAAARFGRLVSKRRESVESQLAGHSPGRKLYWGGTVPDFEQVARIMIAAAFILAALIVNFCVYVWSAVAGFKGSPRWGILNLLFYPVAPIVYGLAVRKELGKRAAAAAFGSTGLLIVVVIGVVLAFR